MLFEMQKIMKSKERLRRQLAAQSFAGELRLLEELRERSLAIGASRARLAGGKPIRAK